jgi:ParB/RepB/Spo0J family partition protein
MKKSVSQNTEPNPESEVAASISQDSPWTEGDIPIRVGNCNVLLIAPHGHPKNDTNSAKLAREVADRLDCYAVINEKYQKPSTAGYKRSSLKGYAVDLNNWSAAEKYKKTKAKFLDVIEKFKKAILETGSTAMLIHIHGIRNGNLLLVANKINEFKMSPESLQAIIGYGQRKGDNTRFTASKTGFVIPLIKSLRKQNFNAAIAPVAPIIVKRKGKEVKKWYCGNHKGRLNQYFYEPKQKVQSVQIEFRKKDVREFDTEITETADILDASLRPFIQHFPVSADQNGAIQQIPLVEIDMEPKSKFMSRLDDIDSDTAEFKRLVDSIKRHGILNPVIVRKRSDTDGKPYQLISGFRRLTALRASITEKDSDGTTVPARVLGESVSDDEAYQISFTENLARQDLSLWEIAQACARIKEEKLAEGEMSKGQIEKHLAELIQKDARTVRRYLKLSSLKNEDITEAVHTGFITPTTALDIGKKDLDEDDIAALLVHIKKFPKTTRSFLRFYGNLEMCSKLSKLSVSDVLNCPNADKFLSLDQKELIARIEHRRKGSGLTPREIIQGKAGSLVKAVNAMDSEVAKKSLKSSFDKAAGPLSNKVIKGFKETKIDARFKIKPLSEDMISVTISAPIDELQNSVDIVSKEIGNGLKQIKTSLKNRN